MEKQLINASKTFILCVLGMKLPIDDSFDVYTLLNCTNMFVDHENLGMDVLILNI